MMSFCRKGDSSFFGLADSEKFHRTSDEQPSNVPSQGNGLSLIFGHEKAPNVVESSAVKSAFSNAVPTSLTKDTGGIWFLDDIGGSIDGLMSCTESLGFESSNERMVDENNTIIEELSNHRYRHCDDNDGANSSAHKRSRASRMTEMKREAKFPPPLTSLNQNGQPSFVLRPVRTDGRLEITEVRIQRPEILCASRENGRLTMHLVKSIESEDETEEQEEVVEEGSSDAEDEEELREEEAEEEEEQESAGGEEWKHPASGGGEGLMRCHELLNHQNRRHHHHRHHHNQELWSRRCVTTR
ncbi:hypothetical protein Ancab_024120 [Ancistrocladus abbreviatus]